LPPPGFNKVWHWEVDDAGKMLALPWAIRPFIEHGRTWRQRFKPDETKGVINCVGHLRESALRRSLFLEVVGLQGVTTKLGFGKECVLDYSAISVCKARPTKRR